MGQGFNTMVILAYQKQLKMLPQLARSKQEQQTSSRTQRVLQEQKSSWKRNILKKLKLNKTKIKQNLNKTQPLISNIIFQHSTKIHDTMQHPLVFVTKEIYYIHNYSQSSTTSSSSFVLGSWWRQRGQEVLRLSHSKMQC